MEYVLAFFGGTLAWVAGFLSRDGRPWWSFFTLWAGFFLLATVVRWT